MLSGDGGGGRWGGVRKKREGDSDLSGREEKKNNSAEWETGLPGSWQKDISPWWQGQKPLSMSCTLQGQQRQEGRGGAPGAPKSLFSTEEKPLKTLPCLGGVDLPWICRDAHRIATPWLCWVYVPPLGTHCDCLQSAQMASDTSDGTCVRILTL